MPAMLPSLSINNCSSTNSLNGFWSEDVTWHYRYKSIWGGSCALEGMVDRGVKRIGKEGLKYVMEEMTETKAIVIHSQ